jgi:hypothetical protein
MYIYTFTLTYNNTDPFLTILWSRITRGNGIWGPMSITATPANAATLRNQATTVGFAFSNITRVPVAPDPEVVP